jgi:hypothetical protein
MPFTAEQTTISYLFEDADGANSTHTLYADGTAAIPDVETFALAHLALLYDPVTPAPIITSLQPYGLNINQWRSNDAGVTTGAGEKEKKGVFLFRTDGIRNPTMKVSIPGIQDAVMTGSNEIIDQANPAVQAFLYAIISGTTDGTTAIVAGIPGVVNSRGNDVITASATGQTAKRAYKYHRQSSKTARTAIG